MSELLSSDLPTASFDVDPATEPFWSAARDGRLVLPWCAACDKPFWYPRGFCPRCAGNELEWRPASGAGQIYSATVVRRAGGAWASHVPFGVAVVQLDEGVALTANVVSIAPEDLVPGRRVHARFEQGSEGDLPALRFAPVERTVGPRG